MTIFQKEILAVLKLVMNVCELGVSSFLIKSPKAYPTEITAEDRTLIAAQSP